MGLFNFSKYTDAENILLEQYSQMISMTGVSRAEAKKIAGDMLDQVIEESKKEGTYWLPQNLGDIILGDAGSDNSTAKKIAENIRQKLRRRKEEGVRTEDIRWWWNLSDVERRIMLKQDMIAKASLYMASLEKSEEISQEQAIEKALVEVAKFHPVFGNPDDTAHASGDDMPIPYELKDRINIYIQKRASENSEKYKNEIEQSSTFNALIRKEIKAGNL